MSFIFGTPRPRKVEKIDPSEDALALRRRIAARGGEQSTLLTGRGVAAQQNVFKSNLGGTSRKRRAV